MVTGVELVKLQERDQKIKRLAKLHRKIAFFGTPENDYMDSGLWTFLKYIRTKDEHDPINPVKPLPVDPETGKILAYILTTFHMLLRYDQIAIPKSRQIMLSWIMAIWNIWLARTTKHGNLMWQSKKEDDAAKMVSMGKDDVQTARMTFLELNLTNPDGTPATWLSDPKILKNKGIAYNRVSYRNHTNIFGVPQGGDQVRQNVGTMMTFDEAAFQDAFGKAFEAAQPALQGGGRAAYISSAAPGYFCDLVNDYDGYRDGADPPYEDMSLPKGMKVWFVRGGIPVLRIHYTADPHKDPDRLGAEWFKTAAARYGGIHSAGWQQEMEINWKVAGGSPVFPQAQDARWPAIIPALEEDFVKKNLHLIVGFDYGSANDPSVYEVIGIDEDGKLYSVWEWYKHGAHYREAAEAIKAGPYFDLVKGRQVADSNLWALDQHRDGQIKSVAQLFAEEGVHFIRGKKGSPSADVRVEEMMRGHYWEDFDNPKAFLTLATPKLIECCKILRWEEHRSEATKARSHSPLKIVHKNNDPWDAWSYPIDLMIKNFKRPAIKLPPDSYRAVRNRMIKADKKAKWARGNVGAL